MVVATVVKVTRSTQVELFDECWTLTMVVELVALAVTCRWATPPLAVLAALSCEVSLVVVAVAADRAAAR